MGNGPLGCMQAALHPLLRTAVEPGDGFIRQAAQIVKVKAQPLLIRQRIRQQKHHFRSLNRIQAFAWEKTVGLLLGVCPAGNAPPCHFPAGSHTAHCGDLPQQLGKPIRVIQQLPFGGKCCQNCLSRLFCLLFIPQQFSAPEQHRRIDAGQKDFQHLLVSLSNHTGSILVHRKSQSLLSI